jgi:glycosyltransferase involved in cell wall biosynthesis
MLRLAVVASHPIQYQAPWFRALASVCDLEVLFCHRQDARGQREAGFGEDFEWDLPLLDGYPSRWLANVAAEPSVDHYRGCDTPEIDDVIASGRYDACLVSGWYLKSYIQAIRSCRRHGTPVLVRGDSQLGGPRRPLTRAAKYLPYRWLLGRVDAHLYVGAANRAYLRHYGVPEARLFFAPHFVDTAWFRRQEETARRDGTAGLLAERLGIPVDRKVVLFVGKLIEKKRPADFVRAIGQLAHRGQSVCGVVVGSGPLAAELRALADSGQIPVHFAGFHNQTAMPACYAIADALVLPSDGRETWGLVVNEAMSCGVPAIVSDAVGSSQDLIDGELTGRRFPCGDVPALAEAIGAVLRTRQDRANDVAAALARMMETYSLERAVAGVLEAVEWVTEGASGVTSAALARERGH